MSSFTRYDLERFDGRISFTTWKIQMRAILIQNGLKKALDGIEGKPASMSADDWDVLDEKALSAIQLMLSKEVLRQVAAETTACGIWKKLEDLYMTKSLANKLRLKERLYTTRMQEGSDIQTHLDEYNSILLDLENLDVKVEDEDRAVLLVVSLPPSYKHFREIMLYGNRSTLSYEDVKSNLLSKEKFDGGHPSEGSVGLLVRGQSSKNKHSSHWNRNTLFCHFCKKTGHVIADCFKLKNKQDREEKDFVPAEADVALDEGHIFFASEA